MNKISKVSMIVMAGLLSLSVPSFFAINSYYNQKKESRLVKAADGYDITGLVLSPIESLDIDTISSGGHYLIVGHNAANYDPDDPNPTTGDDVIYTDQSAMIGFDEEYYSRGFNVTLNDDYSLDVDKYIYEITACFSSFVKETYEHEEMEMSSTIIVTETYLEIINENIDRFLLSQDGSYSFVSSLSFPEYSFKFEKGSLTNSWHLIWDEVQAQRYVYLAYDDYGPSAFNLEYQRYSEFFIYQVPETLYQQYSWKYQFMNISENDDASDLLAMYQNLSPFAKECLLRNFFEGDPDDESAGGYPEYSDFENYLYLDTLLTKFQLYEQIVGATYSKPIVCPDINEDDVVVDSNGYTFSGFSPLFQLYYSTDLDNWNSFPINLSGLYYFFNRSSDEGNAEEFAGQTVYFAYGAAHYHSSYSNNPLRIDFPDYRDPVTVNTEGIAETFAQIPVHIEDNEVQYIDHYFDDEFELAALPEGYEATLVTESFFNYFYNNITDTDNYGDIDTTKVKYSTSTFFNKAYDEEGATHDLVGGTLYYILFRLPAETGYLPTSICGYTSIITPTQDDVVVDKARMENYEVYNETLENERFISAIYSCYDKFVAFEQEMNEILSNMENEKELEDFIAERSISDRYYIECSKYMLLSNYYNVSYPSDRKDQLVESLMDQFNEIIGESGEIDRATLDEFVDNSINSFEEEINLIQEQEYAAMEMAYYLNSLSAIYMVYDDMDGAFEILKQYTNLVYEASNTDQIYELVEQYKVALKQWFEERVS